MTLFIEKTSNILSYHSLHAFDALVELSCTFSPCISSLYLLEYIFSYANQFPQTSISITNFTLISKNSQYILRKYHVSVFFLNKDDYQIFTLTTALVSLEVLFQAHFTGLLFHSLLQN